MTRLGLVFAIALAGAVPAEAAVAPQTTAIDAAARASQSTAAELARTVAPYDVMLPLEIQQTRAAILSLPTLDADAKQLESEYPGIWKAVWAEIEPEMRRSIEASYPPFWAALGQLYVTRLTEEEAQAMLTFYRSPTGQKLIGGMLQNFDASSLMKEVISSPSGSVSAEQLNSATTAARLGAVRTMGPEDEPQLKLLLRSVDLEKFRSIGAETQKLTLEWINDEDAEAEARLERLMEAAMERHMTANPPK